MVKCRWKWTCTNRMWTLASVSRMSGAEPPLALETDTPKLKLTPPKSMPHASRSALTPPRRVEEVGPGRGVMSGGEGDEEAAADAEAAAAEVDPTAEADAEVPGGVQEDGPVEREDAEEVDRGVGVELPGAAGNDDVHARVEVEDLEDRDAPGQLKLEAVAGDAQLGL